jgi:hypothetical protein
MSVGLGTTTLANKILDHLRGGTAWTQPSGLYVKLHLGDPTGAGTSLPSVVTTRSAITFAAASGGIISLTGTNPSWSMTATESISHISVWDAATAGNFLWSAGLTVTKSVQAGDTLTLTSCQLSLASSLAA